MKSTESKFRTVIDQNTFYFSRVVDDSELSKLVLKDEWCPDEPPMNITAWKDTTVVMPENIVVVDADLLAWFKAHTPDYEEQINAVLRSHVESNIS